MPTQRAVVNLGDLSDLMVENTRTPSRCAPTWDRPLAMTLDALDDRGWDDHSRDDRELDVLRQNTLRWTSEHCGVDNAERFVITAWVRSWLAFDPPCIRWPLLAGESGRTRFTVLGRSWLAGDTLHSLRGGSPQHLATAEVSGAGGVESEWWMLPSGFEACSSMARFVG